MKIVVYGAGAVGGTFGGLLAKAGHEVWFIARGQTLHTLTAEGLRVDSYLEDYRIQPCWATKHPASCGTADLILIAVKAGQVEAVAHTLAPLLAEHTRILPLQNGIEAAPQLAAVLGWKHVLGGFCRTISRQAAPGHILHTGVRPTIALGRWRGLGPAFDDLVPVLQQAGIVAELPHDIELALWEKFLFVEPFGTVGAYCRASMDQMLQDDKQSALLRAAVEETVAVGQAAGVLLSAQHRDAVWKQYQGMPAGATTSMQRNLMAGEPSELEAQTGAIVRLARELSVAIPVHERLYAALR